MNIVLVLGFGLLSLLGFTMWNYTKKINKFTNAEERLSKFFDFNKEVTKQLLELENRGRNCYQSLDGDVMRLMYKAQRVIKYGKELERLGIDTLASGNLPLIVEMEKLFDLEVNADETDLLGLQSIGTQILEELTPRAYKYYLIELICEINKRVQLGLENLNKLNLAVVNA